MALTLQRPETDRMARDLAGLTGESIEDAVAAALRDRLDREHQRRDRDALLASARAIVQSVGDLAPGAAGSNDPAAFLYDERGLPG